VRSFGRTPTDQLTPRHIFLWHKSKGKHFHFQLQQLKRAMIITYLSSRRRRSRAAVEDRGSRIADRRQKRTRRRIAKVKQQGWKKN